MIIISIFLDLTFDFIIYNINEICSCLFLKKNLLIVENYIIFTYVHSLDIVSEHNRVICRTLKILKQRLVRHNLCLQKAQNLAKGGGNIKIQDKRYTLTSSPYPSNLTPLKENSMGSEGKLKSGLNSQMCATLDKLLLHWSFNFPSSKLY